MVYLVEVLKEQSALAVGAVEALTSMAHSGTDTVAVIVVFVLTINMKLLCDCRTAARTSLESSTRTWFVIGPGPIR